MTDTADRTYDVGTARRALAIGPGSPREARTIDITTLGRRTGRPRRIEIWSKMTGIPHSEMSTCRQS
ncbi:hypothetical protein JOD64_005562 [Micromonospora luteifusca]|uniref:Uncharacterized protein n=1 Tax=Micromonospora luteifusca TaxID=709860 RepID=A0ABS2M1K7_9ACTN|nr:hypothetical protein [Micromonospora luteifusca]MBM7494340.1 hypothetical protein [Micromonospora luteifusca]